MAELPANQLQAALWLASGESVTAAAEKVGVTRQAVHQWLKNDDAFIAHLND